MKSFKRLFTFGIILTSLSLVMVGCGTDGTTGTTGSGNGGDKKYVIATDATYAPMEYMDANGELVGTDIDIVNAFL